MAQSAIKDSGKSPLGIQPFWEKATLEPPLRWEYRRTQLKLANLAREGIEVDLLLADPPVSVLLPPNQLMKTQLTTRQHNQNEIDVPAMNRRKQRGKISVNALKWSASYAETNRGNYVIGKPLHWCTWVWEWKGGASSIRKFDYQSRSNLNQKPLGCFEYNLHSDS